jgi:hypothetical protein
MRLLYQIWKQYVNKIGIKILLETLNIQPNSDCQ